MVLAGGAAALAGLGLVGARRRRRGAHIAGMGGAYIVVLTAFYVDNGPRLPLWDQLPPAVFWVLPAAAGLPGAAARTTPPPPPASTTLDRRPGAGVRTGELVVDLAHIGDEDRARLGGKAATLGALAGAGFPRAAGLRGDRRRAGPGAGRT